MHILFLLGWFFMLMAFITAASEPFVVVTTLGRADSGNFLTSAYDLWYTYAPGHLVVSKIKIEAPYRPYFGTPCWSACYNFQPGSCSGFRVSI